MRKSDTSLVNEVERVLRAQESAGWMVGDMVVKEKGSDSSNVELYLRDVLQPQLEDRGLTVEYERLRAYYRVALANPPAKRYGVSFTAAEEAGDKPERFDWFKEFGPKLSKRQVRKLRGDRAMDNALNGNEAQKLEAAVRLLLDLKQDDKAMELVEELDLKTRMALAEKIPALKALLNARQTKTGGGGGGRRSSEWGDGDRVAERLARFTDSLTQDYEALAGTLTPEHAVQTRLLAEISRLRSTLDLFEDGLTKGMSFDDFVASLTE